MYLIKSKFHPYLDGIIWVSGLAEIHIKHLCYSMERNGLHIKAHQIPKQYVRTKSICFVP